MKDGNAYKRQAEFFQVLSHPVRLRILDILARHEACVCHLTAVLGERQPYVSQQLAALRKAGFVTDRREGTLIFCRLADEQLVELLDGGKTLAQGLASQRLDFPAVPESAVHGCPCPYCQAA